MALSTTFTETTKFGKITTPNKAISPFKVTDFGTNLKPVSYTHLTLPTILRV